MRSHPLEVSLRKEGILQVAGIDEAGRGPWAGPVVAAAAIIRLKVRIPGLNDSKKLSSTQREALFGEILKKADVGIGVVSDKIIDKKGLSYALKLVFKKAIDGLQIKPGYLLIDGIGNETIRINGVKELGGATHEIIPDRIEAGTFLVAGALTRGNIVLTGVQPNHLHTIIEKLRYAGAKIEIIKKNSLRITGSDEIMPQDVTTSPYPGFPTDMQAQFIVLMTQANGTSIITETIFDRRFSHINELLRLGANIEIFGDKAKVKGKTPLSGAETIATDLRASASLVLAGLIANGETIINKTEHLDRGYEKLEEKMKSLGASIERIKK